MAFEQLDLSTFEFCLACGYLRSGAPCEHRCQCQPRTKQWHQQWQGRDMARDLKLCVLCVRGTVTTWSKWSGNWKGWYEQNIPIADKRYEKHLKELKGQQ